MSTNRSTSLQGTGKHVKEIVEALLEAAYDKDQTVKEVLSTSLIELGQKQPCLVLQSSLNFLQQHAKLPHGHRVVILNVMEQVSKEQLDQVEHTLAIDVIKQAAKELTKSKDITPDWQTAASNLLVALGSRFCNEVMAELMLQFQPGVLPHFFVVQTMANLATVNSYGLVPFLNVVLSQMLHMMGMAKHDNMRWVFSHALSKFCEAILDYEANIEKAPDSTVRRERYAADVFAAFEILNNVWSQTKEVKLRVAIVEAIGNMSHIMSRENLSEQLPKLIQGLLGLYKKNMEPYYVTQGLCQVLQAATADGSVGLEPHIELLLNSLFPQVCQPHDYANPMTVKNHNELLRCFAVLAKSFSPRVVSYLMQRLEQPNERSRIGSLSILRHLINASDEHLRDKYGLVVSGLRVVLTDNSNKVKKVLAQTVMAMSHHGYLQEEGGQDMLQFIIRQCSLIPEPPPIRKNPDPEYVSDENLRSMCENVLQLMTTTVEGIEGVLWPDLLEFVVPIQYTESVGCVCRSVGHITAKLREESPDELILDFEKLVNLPKPEALLARLMVMTGRAMEGRHRGQHLLNAMKGLSGTLHESLVELWDTVIPKLQQYLQDAVDDETKWSQKNWEDLVLKLLSKSLDTVDDDDWVCSVGAALGEQIPLYEPWPLEKNFLYKCLGVVLRKTVNRDFVVKYVDVLFSSVKHSSHMEREGCAVAMGFAAASHLDAVLAKLEGCSKLTSRKGSGIFGFFKDSQDVDEKLIATLVLSYGYVTLYAPQSLIMSRMETSIIKNVLPHYAQVKDPVIKRNLIEAAELIARAMHPDHLKTKYKFKERGELLNHMQAYIKNDITNPVDTEIRKLAIDACTTLIKPEVILTDEEIKALVGISVEAVMTLPSYDETRKDESYQDHLKSEQIHQDILHVTNNLFKEILHKDPGFSNLDSAFQEIYPYTIHNLASIRLRAIQLILQLLQNFREKLQSGIGMSPNFGLLGNIMGKIVPRCSDPDVEVRQVAIEASYVLFCIELKYQGHSSADHDDMISALPTLKERAKRNDPNVLFSVVNDLAKVLCRKVPSPQLKDFINNCMTGLLDPMSHSASGACIILNTAFKVRGSELQTSVIEIFPWLHSQVAQIQNAQTKAGTLRAIRTLVGHHLVTSLDIMLKYPLPLDQSMKEIWQMIALDVQLTKSIMDNLVDLLTRHMPYEERGDPRDSQKTIKVSTLLPLAATCALTELLQVQETETVVGDHAARLLAVFMVRLASTVGASPPQVEQMSKGSKSKQKMQEIPLDPCGITIDALQHMVVRAQLHELNDTLTSRDTWTKLQDPENYADGFMEFARALVEVQPGLIAKITTHITAVLTGVYDCQRIMAAAFLSELIAQRCGGDMTLVDMVINTLLGRLVDPNPTVRKMCIRGLGNIASTEAEQVQKYSTTILSAMMAGMDDKEDLEDEITLEAMSGLSRILTQIDESHIRPILINIALRIRPCFEKEQAEVRAAAVELFGNLSRFANGPSEAPFMEQVHSNLVSLLLHLNDEEAEVKNACKAALKKLGPLLGSEDVNKMCQKYLITDASLHYGEFMNDLSKVLIKDFKDKLNFYSMGCVTFFKSMNEEIRSNATMFLGFLLGNMPVEQYSALSKEHVCSALILLLKDSSGDVRIKAGEAMSRLHQF